MGLAAACGGSGGSGTSAGSGGGGQALPQAAPLPASCQPTARAAFQLPSDKGLNYGEPETAGGDWLGTTWLRSDTASTPGWKAAKPRFQADLDFIAGHNLGKVVRIFIGLDQLMVWDRSTGFVRYDEASLRHLTEALDMIDAHNLKAIAVLYDQEQVSSPGNFRVQALDGSHPEMRAGYLRALDQFLKRFGSRQTVAAWDLFNEPFNSLGTEGGLPRKGADPISPNYSDHTVRAWILDLYRTARCADPNGWFTVSDTTELYFKDPPDTRLYAGALDFYDIHVYDDNPTSRSWRQTLDKPFILGEVGAVPDQHLASDTINPRAVSFWLAQGPRSGASAVLAQRGGANVYSLTGGLAPTGRALAAAQ
jgi:hypothetical protein